MLRAVVCLSLCFAVALANNDWDYLVLMQQWPGSVCDGSEPCPTNGWTMHGLWPNRNDGSYPQFCSTTKFDPSAVSSIMNDLNAHWPSLTGPSDSFWSHEFEKHGTCASSDSPLSTELEYFQSGLNLLQQYQFATALSNAGITPSSQSVSVSSMQAAIKSAYGYAPVLECKSGKVTQGFLCVSKTLELMDCPANAQTEACSESSVSYPPVSSSTGATVSNNGDSGSWSNDNSWSNNDDSWSNKDNSYNNWDAQHATVNTENDSHNPTVIVLSVMGVCAAAVAAAAGVVTYRRRRAAAAADTVILGQAGERDFIPLI